MDSTAVFSIKDNNWVHVDLSIHDSSRYFNGYNSYTFYIKDEDGKNLRTYSTGEIKVPKNCTKNRQYDFKINSGDAADVESVSMYHNVYWNPVNVVDNCLIQ